MYSTCLYCRARLGANEVLESFPVGRRIAFDPARGRLWVVCRVCGRWNLSPLEERWEAFEHCERLYRRTRLRLSTENIGMARLREGMDLIRVGNPLRPELAGWRYGRVIARRRLRTIAGELGYLPFYYALGTVSLSLVASVPVLAPWIAIVHLIPLVNSVYHCRAIARVRVADDPPLQLSAADVFGTRIRREGGGWALDVRHLARGERRSLLGSITPIRQLLERRRSTVEVTTLEGTDAIRAAAVILPVLNQMAGGRSELRDAVEYYESAGSVENCFAASMAATRDYPFERESLRLNVLPTPVLLAMEMAAHEETERRALEGELLELEHAWRDAEEVASIADDLLLPPPLRRKLIRIKESREAGAMAPPVPDPSE